MDEAVNTAIERSAGLAVLLAFCAAAHAATPSAQGLQDPTRPPAAASAAAAGADGVKAGPQLPQLQSVLVGAAAGERRIAVIDGESVRVGDSFRGARVLRIADNEVELQRGRERQVLRLYAPEGSGGMARVGRLRSRDKGEQ